jgi:hypothetical protein
MTDDDLETSLIDAAAAELLLTSRAFTQGNLYHAVRRLRPALGTDGAVERFFDIALARRLRHGPLTGLLPAVSARRGARVAQSSLSLRERSAYFPAAILLVDRPEIVDLFAASGVLVQARVAVVCIDGSPPTVVSWLCHAARRGHRAPVGYLHDARTVLYPFLFEPFATIVESLRGRPLAYRDLGIGPGLPVRDPLHIADAYAAGAQNLEELPPSSLVAYAAQQLLEMVAPDTLLLPMRPSRPARVA